MNHEHKREDDIWLWVLVIGMAIIGGIIFWQIDSRLAQLECQINPVCMEASSEPPSE